MSVQMIELDEVTMVEASDESLEATVAGVGREIFSLSDTTKSVCLGC